VTKARSNAVAEAAKGDLSVGSGTNLAGILAVGNNGETLVADSSTSTGLRYQGSMAAAKNAIINGGFDIWQRGTSFASSGSINLYGPDRWVYYRASGATGGTYSRQSSGLTGFQYSMRVQRDSGNTNTGYLAAFYSVESANSIPFAGKAITFSFYAKAGANYSATSSALGAVLVSGTGIDQNVLTGYTGSVVDINQTATLTTSWQRFTYTATLGSSVSEFGLQLVFNPTGTAGANDWFEVTGVQVEIGSVATNFTRTGGNIQGELAACQRYYYRATGGSSGQAIAGSTTAFEGIIPFKVPMRVTPTVLDTSGTRLNDGITTPNTSTLTLNASNSSTESAYLTGTVASGLAQYRTYFFNVSSSSGYYGFSAEL
jgi:hypothetical protein